VPHRQFRNHGQLTQRLQGSSRAVAKYSLGHAGNQTGLLLVKALEQSMEQVNARTDTRVLGYFRVRLVEGHSPLRLSTDGSKLCPMAEVGFEDQTLRLQATPALRSLAAANNFKAQPVEKPMQPPFLPSALVTDGPDATGRAAPPPA